MRALAAVLVAVFVIALSGAAPVSAQESSTPGIWINPELGLATPGDAARRYEGPFHEWWIDEDDSRRQEPDWRERAFLLFGEDWPVKLRIWSQVAARDISLAEIDWYSPEADKWSAEIPPPPPEPAPLRVESCAALLAAYRAGLRPRPALELDWYARHHCRILSHVARLMPVETPTAEHPDFLDNAWTARHLSPLAYISVSMNSFCKKYRSEIEDKPHHHLRDKNARYVGPEVFYGSIHERPWDEAMSDGNRVWAVWAQAPAVEVAGIAVSPLIRLESEESVLTFAVQGVGSLSGHHRPVFVVKAGHNYKVPDCHGCPFFGVLVLSYDLEIEIFRTINLEDFEPYFMDDSYWRQRCLPQMKEPLEKGGP